MSVLFSFILALVGFIVAFDLGRPPENDPSDETHEIPGTYPSSPETPPAPQAPHAECQARFAQESLNQVFKCTM